MNTRNYKFTKGLILLVIATALIAACQPATSANQPANSSANPTLPANGASSASGSAVVDVSSNATLGKFLVDSKGMTLYLFTKDTAGVSNCADKCLANWPALTFTGSGSPTGGTGVTGKLGTITRSDGTVQVTYNDMPLYYFIGDKAAGDTTGQGVGSVWYVVAP